MSTNNLEFRRRLPADVVYKYERVLSSEKTVWKRVDLDLWVKYLPHLGWVGVNENDEVLSVPWPPTTEGHGNLPPEGKWVSCKGDKSYVYDVVYT